MKVGMELKAPFPWMGGKRSVTAEVWARFGSPKHYIEPFCGSAAMLLAAPSPASLEVINDMNGFVANFWRATKAQPEAVAHEADYPVSHLDLGARHVWLMAHRADLEALQDPEWPGDARIAGWWLWGQCCWIGRGWCDWTRDSGVACAGDAGHGVQAIGQIPQINDTGRGVQAIGKIPHDAAYADDAMLTSSGRTAWQQLHRLAQRLERVRIIHGDWSRCLNSTYGGTQTAVFLDPPYRHFNQIYNVAPVADEVEAWARDYSDLKIALCGHEGDYDLPGWDIMQWDRKRIYGSDENPAREGIWFSPACLSAVQGELF